MRKFTMEFSIENAAFDEKEHEISRILRTAAEQVENGLSVGTVRDVNGNAVGRWEYDA